MATTPTRPTQNRAMPPGAVIGTDAATGRRGVMTTINGQKRFVPFEAVGGEASPAEGVGIGEAFKIGAGQMASNFGQRIGAVLGQESALQEIDDVERLMQPLRAERSFSTSIGEGVPMALIPGGKAVQGAVGAVEGALMDPENRLAAGIEGGIASVVGGAMAERAFRMVRGLFGGTRGTLAAANVPTTAAQRGNQFFQAIEPGVEAIPLLNRWAAAPARAQQQALNRMAGEALGFAPRVAENVPLTRSGLQIAKEGIQVKFRRVANAIPDTQLPDEIVEQIGDLNTLNRTSRELIDLNRPLTGDEMLRVRSAMNDQIAKLALDGAMPEANALRVTLNQVDDLIERGIDDRLTMDLWREGRQQWRFLTAITRGRALSADGTVNLASARNAINKIYPNFRTGAQLPGRGQQFGELLAALDELPASIVGNSGTANRQTGAAILLGLPTVGAVEPGAAAVGAAIPSFVTGNLVAQPGARIGAAVQRGGVRGAGSPIEAAITERLEAIDRTEADEGNQTESR